MEAARWLIVFVACVTAIGGLLADYFIPTSGRQHFRNPNWPPHAKFHNAQTILLGLCLGVLAIAILFLRRPLSMSQLGLAAIVSSLYWIGIFGARIFPGTAWVDLEFASAAPTPMRMPFQLLIGLVLVAILVLALGSGFIGTASAAHALAVEGGTRALYLLKVFLRP